MLAFILSTAIHIGALTSNLMNVNAESVPAPRQQAVKLHIVSPAARMPVIQPPETAREIPERKIPDPPADPPHLMPVVQNIEITPVEQPTAVKVPVYREETVITDNAVYPPKVMPDPPPTASPPVSEDFLEERPDIHSPVPALNSENESEPCDDCSALLASIPSMVKNGLQATEIESGPTTPATITLSSKPKYPRYSRLHKEEGTTILTVEVLPDGKLGCVEVVQSSGYRRLDQAAVKGMQKAEVVPAMMDGIKVASVKRISIKFDLEDWGE
jgi:protein TonB